MLLIETTRSSLARGISNANLAESLMAFNTNYRDTGIFGIYTIAPVSLLLNLLSLY
jgi:processing peptidase subunit beta